MVVLCVLLPRVGLLAALREDRARLFGRPLALAPEPGRRGQAVGEASAAAEAFGVTPGMRLGEALARCPELELVPADPEAVAVLWERVLDALEQLGASMECDRPGEAYFVADGLCRLHGGDLEAVVAAVRRVISRGERLGAAPTRFCAYVAARTARPRRRLRIVRATEVRSFLAPLPLQLLRARPELGELPDALERLGIQTLGGLASLPAGAVVERFGHQGLLALDLARGRDTPLEPRRPFERVAERLELPEGAHGMQLERALDLLLARIVARRERRARALRVLVLTAGLVEGGSWRRRVVLRAPSADPAALRQALAPRLVELPAPASSLGLEVEAFGPPAERQQSLVQDAGALRRARLDDALRQVRHTAGEEALLRVLELDPGSRLPEHRAVLAPYAPEGDRP